MNKVDKFIESLGINVAELHKLESVGGHAVYHLEGNAFIHTLMVVEQALKLWLVNNLMVKVAVLHDIGKIEHHVEDPNNPGCFMYPHHSDGGAADECLSKFIAKNDPDYRAIQWYIFNHIKPLYWQKNGVNTTPIPEGLESVCTLDNLRKLALCDIRGSKAVQPQTELIDYLESLDL